MSRHSKKAIRVGTDVFAELKSLKEENARLQKDRVEFQKVRTDLVRSLKSVKKENDGLNRFIETQHTIIAGLKKNLNNQSAREEFERVEKENEKLFKENEMLKKAEIRRFRERTDARADYNINIQEWKKKNDKLLEDVQLLERERTYKDKAIEHLKERVEELRGRIAKLELEKKDAWGDAWDKGYSRGSLSAQYCPRESEGARGVV